MRGCSNRYISEDKSLALATMACNDNANECMEQSQIHTSTQLSPSTACLRSTSLYKIITSAPQNTKNKKFGTENKAKEKVINCCLPAQSHY